MKNLLFSLFVLFLVSACTGQKVRHSNVIGNEHAHEDRVFLQVTDAEIEKYSSADSPKNIFYRQCADKNAWKTEFKSFSECIQHKRSRNLTEAEIRFLENKYEKEGNPYFKGSIEEAIEKKRVRTR